MFSVQCGWVTGDITASAASSRAVPGSAPQLIHVTLRHNVLAAVPSFTAIVGGYFHTQQSVSLRRWMNKTLNLIRDINSRWLFLPYGPCLDRHFTPHLFIQGGFMRFVEHKMLQVLQGFPKVGEWS